MGRSASEPQWLESNFCGDSSCVEVAKVDGRIRISNSKTPTVVLRSSAVGRAGVHRVDHG
jgi:hypothetical protein